MQEINILYLENVAHDNEYKNEINETMEYISTSEDLLVQRVDSIDEFYKINLSEFDIFIFACDEESHLEWLRIAEFIDENEFLRYLGFIIIFCFDDSIKESAREAVQRGFSAFACPFNYSILEAHIYATAFQIESIRSLDQLQTKMYDANNLHEIAKIALDELRNHPSIGYDRASLSLVENNQHRYLLYSDPFLPNPDRSLLKNIKEDYLISNLLEREVIVLGDLNYLRNNRQKELRHLGWVDVPATGDITSWIGLAAIRQNQCIAVITLDSNKPGRRYSSNDEKLSEFLRNFAKLLADFMFDFSQERNSRIVDEILFDAGKGIPSDALVRQMLSKLRSELKCDKISYFRTIQSTDSREPFLEEWVNSEDENRLERPRIFGVSEGVVGSVLASKESRIVPNALESDEFEQTPKLSGVNLSMLAVPIFPYQDLDQQEREKRIVGVISCHKKGKDFFTIYDKNLIESIAKNTSALVEKTMTLEYSSDINNSINRLIFNPSDNSALLEIICEHAMRITSARAAVIRKFKSISKEGEKQYFLTGERYTFPEGLNPRPPRMNEGTTYEVIKAKRTLEFSSQFGNFNLIQEELRKKGIKYQIVVPLLIHYPSSLEQEIIGAIYLNKYSETPFSESEKFAVELFARQAANAIYHQEIFSEKQIWAKGNSDLAEAIEKIATTENVDKLLQDIADYSCDLADASFGYVALVGEGKNPEIKAAWPESLYFDLVEFHNTNPLESRTKRGIVGLAIDKEETILIGDLDYEKEVGSEYGLEYIQFQRKSRSELVVLIKEDTSGRVIGLLNLEHESPYKFNEAHKELIEHFARQVAIALQKKKLVNSISKSRDVLMGLQKSLQKIIEVPFRDMLDNAAYLTKVAIEADRVIILPIRNKKWKKLLILEEIAPSIDGLQGFELQAIKKLAFEVYESQEAKDVQLKLNPESSAYAPSLYSRKNIPSSEMQGFCLPFSSRDNKIGVMLLLFERATWKQSDEELAIYQVYANQIALAYDNSLAAKRVSDKLNESQSRITKNIHKNYSDARWQSIVGYCVSVFAALSGLTLIVFGGYRLFDDGNNSRGELAGDTALLVFGIILEAVPILAFKWSEKAHDRMDKYHQELYNVHQLEILLSVTDQLDPEKSLEVKHEIVRSAATSWIQQAKKLGDEMK